MGPNRLPWAPSARRASRSRRLRGARRSATTRDPSGALGVYFDGPAKEFIDEQLEEGRSDRLGRSARRPAVAQFLGDRAARNQAADSLRRPAAPVRRLRPDQERLRRAGLRPEAHQGSDQRNGARARPAFRFSRRRRLQGPADLDAGQVRRPRHRGRRRRRHGQGHLSDRRHAGLPRRHQVRRPDRQDRRQRDARHAARQGRRADARQARHVGRADRSCARMPKAS